MVEPAGTQSNSSFETFGKIIELTIDRSVGRSVSCC